VSVEGDERSGHLSSGTWHCVAQQNYADVSEEYTASIFIIEELAKQVSRKEETLLNPRQWK
jgi:hypothetical protein